MNSAEYRTLREACGLSQQDASAYHAVAIRTISHWESGRNNVPAGAAEELLSLTGTIETGVAKILAAKPGRSDAIHLTRYRTSDDYAGTPPDRAGLPHACHNAMIGRAMVALRRMDREAVISWAPAAATIGE